MAAGAIFDEVEILALFCNPQLVPIVRSYAKDLIEVYNDNIFAKTVIECIVDCGDNISLLKVKERLENSEYFENNQTIAQTVMRGFQAAYLADSQEVEFGRRYLERVLAKKFISNAQLASDSQSLEFIRYLQKNVDTTKFSSNLVNGAMEDVLFSEMDITEIEEESKNNIPSVLGDFISYGGAPGYKRGGILCCYSFPPSGGKSILMLNEAISMAMKGYKVLYLAILDMLVSDFATRGTAIANGVSITDATKNVRKNFEMMREKMGDAFNNLRLNIVKDAERISMNDYWDYVISKKYHEEYDVFFIDYDSNLNGGDLASDNMYAKGGLTYNSASQFAKTYDKLVIIASQPKTEYYGEEEIPLEGLAESSKKQQICDLIITGSHPTHAINHTGKICIVKNRRGELDGRYYFLDPSGRFIFLDNYETYKHITNSMTRITMVDTVKDSEYKFMDGSDFSKKAIAKKVKKELQIKKEQEEFNGVSLEDDAIKDEMKSFEDHSNDGVGDFVQPQEKLMDDGVPEYKAKSKYLENAKLDEIPEGVGHVEPEKVIVKSSESDSEGNKPTAIIHKKEESEEKKPLEVEDISFDDMKPVEEHSDNHEVKFELFLDDERRPRGRCPYKGLNVGSKKCTECEFFKDRNIEEKWVKCDPSSIASNPPAELYWNREREQYEETD